MWPWVAQLQMPHSNIRSAQSQISLSWSNSNQHTRCFISLQLKEERILGLLVYLDDVIHHPLVACFSDIFKLCKQEQVSLQGSIQYLNHCVAVCSGVPKIVRRKNYLLTEESSSRPRLRVPFAMADRVNWTKCNNIVVAHWWSETRWVEKKCLVVSREFPHYSLTVSLTTKERFQSNLKSRGSVFLLNPESCQWIVLKNISHTLLSLHHLLPQVSSLHPAPASKCLWETRRSMLCCSSQWFSHVSTPPCPTKPPWCSGSTSHTVVTAPGIHLAFPTTWVEVWEEEGWQAEREESAEGTRRGWQPATSTALTTVGPSELWLPSLVPQSHCQSTTRTETSPSLTVSVCGTTYGCVLFSKIHSGHTAALFCGITGWNWAHQHCKRNYSTLACNWQGLQR